jgi:dTDP-4-dehydrorhamnose reductase
LTKNSTDKKNYNRDLITNLLGYHILRTIGRDSIPYVFVTASITDSPEEIYGFWRYNDFYQIMVKMKRLAITGLSGVIGTVLLHQTQNFEYQIYDLYHTQLCGGKNRIKKHIPFNLLQRDHIIRTLDSIKPDKIVHMAAITHIDPCEQDKKYGKNGIVWKINVEGTREIVKFCLKNRVPIIYLSTECVFDGKNDFYDEFSKKNPINWYGQTKSEAEDILLSSGAKATIIRSVMAYHTNDNSKTIFGKIYDGLKNRGYIQGVTDQFITPTHIYDITQAIEYCITHDTSGIFHISPNVAITPYEFALLIAKKYGYQSSQVDKITLEKFYGSYGASLRLRHACLWGKSSNNSLHTHVKSPNIIFG